MSLTPLLFSDWWEELDRPHRIFDQHFGLSFEPKNFMNLLPPSNSEIYIFRPNRQNLRRHYHPFLHNLNKKSLRGASTIQKNKDDFQVTLDVQQFAPDEINVKVVDKNIVIEAKHEDKKDEHGWISRQFVRKYLFPSQCDIDQVESHLSSDGVLTVTAPRKQKSKDNSERSIRIQYTGHPAIKQHDEASGQINGDADSREQTQQKNQPQRGKRSVKAP